MKLKAAIFIFFIFINLVSFGQPDSGGGGDPGGGGNPAPLGGIGILIAAGAYLGFRKINSDKKGK